MSSIASAISTAAAGATAGSTTGIDVQGMVDQVLYADRAPERLWQTQQTFLSSQSAALSDINSKLSTLLTNVNALKDVTGQFSAKAAVSSNSSVVSVTADSSAAAGNHTIVVNSLATTASYYTAQQPSSSSTLSSGSFSLQVGSGSAVTITIDSTNNTLDKLAASINSQNAGVTASVVTDANGARLSLVSATSGAAGDVTVSNDTSGLGFTKSVTGTNASLTVDGVPGSYSSNIVKGAIPGVTLSLTSASSNPVTVSVSPDTTQAKSAIDAFVSSYNTVVQAINAQFQFSQTSGSIPPLQSDNSLMLVEQQLQTAVNQTLTGNNGITSLTSIGLNLQQDGTISEDSATLNNALASNFSAVQTFFQQTSGTQGFAQQLSSSLSNLTDPTQGPLNLELTGIGQEQNDLTQQISDFEANLSVVQDQLVAQFSQIDATLQQLPSMLSQINGQLASIPK